MDLGRGELRIAAQLRAVHPALRTPDALQLSAGCTSFVTNDRALPALPGLPVLQLRDYA